VNISLNLMLVPVYGLLAASVMTVLTEVILVAQHAWSLRGMIRRLNWKNTLLRPALAAGLMGVGVLAVRSYLPSLATIGIGVLMYFILLLLTGAVGREELRFAKEISGLKSPKSSQSM
jgi:O-antigen/teichoic acid export membrane protein